MMPRRPSHDSEDGRRLFAALQSAQRRVEQAEQKRDDLALDAVERGLSAHSLGAALKIDPATAWRKYARGDKKVSKTYYVDGEPVSIRTDMVMPHAANLAMRVLGRTEPRMILERENGELPNQQSAIGDVCAPGDRLKLVPAPADDREGV